MDRWTEGQTPEGIPYYPATVMWQCKKPNESVHDKTYKMACAPSEASDQPEHPPSLIRVFAVRMKKAWVLSYQFKKQFISSEANSSLLMGCPLDNEAKNILHRILFNWSTFLFEFLTPLSTIFQSCCDGVWTWRWELIPYYSAAPLLYHNADIVMILPAVILYWQWSDSS